jgi:hypothetical protein
MKKIFTAFLLFFSLMIEAQTTYYIDPSGTNANSGSIDSPWLTLAYACAHVITPGDIIHVNAGTYTETAHSDLAVDVSIEGTGVTSVINCKYTSGNTLVLTSGTEGTDGNQHIFNIKMSGGSGVNSEVAYAAILVDRRKNVEIANCTFENFVHHGVRFAGSNTDYQPTTYPTGNSFHDNIVTNCCNFVGIGTPNGSGQGCLEIGGQQDMLVYNNKITVSYRTGGLNGYDIKYCMSGYNKGLKIYNNTFIRPPFSGTYNDFDFSLELWNCRGGIEIYNNTINGSIDMSGDNPAPCNDEGGYGFAAKIHNNTIGWTTWQANEQMGIDIERAHTGGMYIYNNNFSHLSTPIIFYQGYDSRAHDIVEDIYIYYNIATNVGYTSAHYSNFISIGHIGTDANPNIIYRKLYILNNTAVQGSGGAGTEGFMNIHIAGTGSYFYIKNNIIVGFGAAGGGGVIDVDGSKLISLTNVTLQNNLYYQNAVNGMVYYYGGSASFDVDSANITGNPLFASTTNLHLTSGSPAINAGIQITKPSITTDYDSITIGNPPDIGAYEFISNHSPSILDQGFQLNEYSPNGTSVGTVIATDPDAGQKLTYSIISGNTDGAFAINDSTGELSVSNSAALNADFEIVVKVKDNGVGELSSQATIAINIIPAGIKFTEMNQVIKVYPNPVSDKLIIEIEGNKNNPGVEILNSMGQVFFKGNLSEKTIVQTSNFSPGIYFMKIENCGSFEFKKIVKM